MLKQKNVLYLLFMLIPCLQTTIFADTIALDRPTNFHIPDNMPMPSVDDLFGNMTEEQIVQQIQEAQKLFESLSPEEMEEFAKIVDETWAKMPPSDKEAIQDIANMVKPYFPEPEEEIVKKSEAIEEPINKRQKIEVKNNSIQDLIDNINAQIDDILQKISSSKDLVEEFTTKWASKVTFDNLKRQILALKEDRLSNKLVTKANAEDKELVEKLEKFYKDLKAKNEPFYVEDTFGLPSSSKSQDTKQLKQAKDILNVFDDGIDNVMPKIEAFLKKHAPETLEMAKEADERAKRAATHAKDASVKRGSAAAVPSPEPTRKTTTSAQPSTTSGSVGGYAGGYDPYASYGNYGGGYGNYGSSYDYPSATPSQGDYKAPAIKDETKKEETKKTEEKKDDSKKKKEVTPYDEAVDNLAEYFEDIDNKANQDFLNFLEQELPDYPKATDRTGTVTRPITQQDWLYSTGEFENWFNGLGKFVNKGFKAYTNSIKDGINKYASQIKRIHKACAEIERNIKKMSEAELKKFADDKSLKQLQDRTKKYLSDFDEARIKIRKQQADNQDSVLTFLTDSYLTDYQKFHDDFELKLDAFKTDLKAANDAVQEVYKRIKGAQRRNKVAAEKEAQKAAAFGF